MSSRTRPRKTATPPAPQESTLLRWLKERRITGVTSAASASARTYFSPATAKR